jgi:acid stress-induced BolA-like protein IbaG/YrbA
MDFKEELEMILSDIGLKNPTVEISVTPEGKVGGFVVSESFCGKSQIERQDMLWDRLDEILDEEKNLKIIALLTMTPAEVEDADSD